MIMASCCQSSSCKSLLFIEYSEKTEHDRLSRFELDLHEPMGYSFCNVLEMHGLSLDEYANRNDGVETICERIDWVGESTGS